MDQLQCHTIDYSCAVTTRKHLQLLRRQCRRFALCPCTKRRTKNQAFMCSPQTTGAAHQLRQQPTPLLCPPQATGTAVP
jgi:hypothetical protein